MQLQRSERALRAERRARPSVRRPRAHSRRPTGAAAPAAAAGRRQRSNLAQRRAWRSQQTTDRSRMQTMITMPTTDVYLYVTCCRVRLYVTTDVT